MRRGVTLAAAIAMVGVLCGASPNKVPEEVAAHMREMTDACRAVDGKPLTHKFVEHGSLADGLGFWVINHGAFECDGDASLYSGTGGSEVLVYLVLPNGHGKQVFGRYVYGMAMERTGTSAKLWLGVSGAMCGQEGSPTHGDSISCDRPLVWDAKAQKLDFAPLSQTRFPGRLGNGGVR